jgi:hypothetical protein
VDRRHGAAVRRTVLSLGRRTRGGKNWHYRFSYWPDEQILRKVVDYEQDVFEREQNRGLMGKLKDWLS